VWASCATTRRPISSRWASVATGRRPGSSAAIRQEAVERSDRPSEQAAAATQQVSLRPLDVGAGRHDKERLVVEPSEEALEEELDLPRIGRADEKAQRHRSPILFRARATGSS